MPTSFSFPLGGPYARAVACNLPGYSFQAIGRCGSPYPIIASKLREIALERSA